MNLIVIETWTALSYAGIGAAFGAFIINVSALRTKRRSVRQWMDRCSTAELRLADLGYFRTKDGSYQRDPRLARGGWIFTTTGTPAEVRVPSPPDIERRRAELRSQRRSKSEER